MPKYEVHVYKTEEYMAKLMVEAEDPLRAEDAAMQMALDDELLTKLNWRETCADMEVYATEAKHETE